MNKLEHKSLFETNPNGNYEGRRVQKAHLQA